jgi:hypothetical protein
MWKLRFREMSHSQQNVPQPNITCGPPFFPLTLLTVNFLSAYVYKMSCYFTVLDDVNRHNRRFNAEGIQLTVKMLVSPPASEEAREAARHFTNSVDNIFEYSLRDLEPSDMVGEQSARQACRAEFQEEGLDRAGCLVQRV